MARFFFMKCFCIYNKYFLFISMGNKLNGRPGGFIFAVGVFGQGSLKLEMHFHKKTRSVIAPVTLIKLYCAISLLDDSRVIV